MKGSFRVVRVAFVAVLGTMFPVFGSSLNFRAEETLSTLGLRLPLMTNARALPLPPVQTYAYHLTRGAETWTEDRFDPYALWYESQHVAEWRDPHGNRMVLGAVSAVLPAAFTERHVTREHFANLVASAAARIERLDASTLQRWMFDFSGVQVGAPEVLNVNRSRLSELYRFPSEDPRLHAYVFQLDPRRAGQAHVADLWFALLVATVDPDAARDRAIVERELLGNLGATGRFERRAEPARAARAARLGAVGSVREHPSREAAWRSVEHLPDWWVLDSKDYVVLSNHRAAERFARDLLEDLQTARALYTRTVPGFAATPEDVSVVRIFATTNEYEDYVGTEHRWTAGLFDPMRRELVIRPSEARGRGGQYARTLRVALHEAFHQYLFQTSGGVPTSAWFNEGHATYFEVATVGDRRIVIAENEDRVGTLEKLVAQKAFDLRALLTLDYADFYRGTDLQREAHYSLAWGLVYYLRRGAPLERNRPHAAILSRYMMAFAQGRSPNAATAEAFEGVDLTVFSRAFHEFWRTSHRRAAARRAPMP